jgi:hypothetical protein
MSNSEHDAQERERQYQIDAITYRYAEEHRARREPRVEEYAARYPQYSAELTEFALYFPAVGADLPTAEAAPDPTLSPAAAAVLARIHTEHAAPVPAEVPATDGLVAQAARVGLAPRAGGGGPVEHGASGATGGPLDRRRDNPPAPSCGGSPAR